MVSHLNKGFSYYQSMKLQKVKAREYKGKTIYKYIIVIPPKDIEQSGWREGIELQGIIIKGKGYFISSKD